jgi:protein OS-9
MCKVVFCLSVLASLSPSLGLRHGSSQLRDLLAFPKYEVQFLNDLPLAESDASRCRSLGIEREEEWLGLRAPFMDGRRLGDGSEAVSSDVRSVSSLQMWD